MNNLDRLSDSKTDAVPGAAHFNITREELERAEDWLFPDVSAFQPGLNLMVRRGKNFPSLLAPALKILKTHGAETAIAAAVMSCYTSGLTVGLQIAANRAVATSPAHPEAPPPSSQEPPITDDQRGRQQS